MAKIVKQSVKKFPHSSSLKIFKFETSKYYYYSFYVGTHITKSGNKEGSLRTSNVKVAMKKAKEILTESLDEEPDFWNCEEVIKVKSKDKR